MKGIPNKLIVAMASVGTKDKQRTKGRLVAIGLWLVTLVSKANYWKDDR